MGRKKFSADFQLMFRLLKLLLFIGSIVTVVVLFTVLDLTVGDIFASLLAFMPTGWALLQVPDAFEYIYLYIYIYFSNKSLYFLYLY
jgi:callose synthase